MRVNFKRGLFRLWLVLAAIALPFVVVIAIEIAPSRERITDGWRSDVASAFSEFHERRPSSDGSDPYFEILAMKIPEVETLVARFTSTYTTIETDPKPVKLSDVLLEKSLDDAAAKRDRDIARLSMLQAEHYAFFLGGWLAVVVGVYVSARILGWVLSGFRAA